jgi:hypothetical protein
VTILSCYVTDETLKRLKAYAEWRGDGRSPEQLAEAAIENAAIECERWLPKREPPLARDD